MTHFTGKAARVLVLSAATALLLAATAAAADVAIGVGATTGSSLRLRAESNTSSPILTTLNKGVAVSILSESDGWYQINYAGKTGFVSADYLVEDQDGEFTSYGVVNGDGVNLRAESNTDGAVLATLDQGAALTVDGFTDGWFSVSCDSGTGYIRSDFADLMANDPAAAPSAAGIVEDAKQYLGTRYVYGGASPGGFDCSGFTMYLYQQYGVSLPHSATSQWLSSTGTKITSISELQSGDLVFFCDPSRSNGKACSHAGLYIGGGSFIHASSSKTGVVISDLTSGYYNNYFVGGKRI